MQVEHACRLPIGAEIIPGGGVRFRVWAPRRLKVAIVLEEGPGRGALADLQVEPNGYFSASVSVAAAGTLYRYRLDDEPNLYPDPASRFQPHGPHGPSQIIDARQFAWTDRGWRGCGLLGQIIYEMHIGTFTPQGTWEAAAAELPELAAAGISVLEVMPVADFSGSFGWGYDGVDLFAPTRLYGSPDDFRRFVDRAHGLDLGVILDVVYNHVGPDGNYLKQFSEDYFTDRYANEWGEALNFDGPSSGPVREFFIANAGYWIDEFHIDGLRLDATPQICDCSPEHILTAITRRVREAAAGRATLVIAENETQHVRLIQPSDQGGYGLDGIWNDDFHHSALVALTGRREAYYSDFRGSVQELLSAVKWGFLFQGQRYSWHKKRRGTPCLEMAAAHFVIYLDNHDQVANSAQGLRCHQLTSPGRHRALTALLLLAPSTPMLFQGQEFSSSSPFLFFADHPPELARIVARGRAQFLSQFPSIALPEVQATLADPADPRTFERCKLDLSERQRHGMAYTLYRDLLKLRREDPVFRAQRPHGVDGAVLDREALVLRFFGERGGDRLLLVNLGPDLHLDCVPEPLLAPPADQRWELLWSSEEPRYGGSGSPHPEAENGWRLPAHAALVLTPDSRGSGVGCQGPGGREHG
jgi:maltooligosyltrehalose trehalohydrolase